MCVCVLATHLSMTTEKRSATTVFFWLVLHDAAEWTRFLSLFLAAAVLKAIACAVVQETTIIASGHCLQKKRGFKCTRQCATRFGN